MRPQREDRTTVATPTYQFAFADEQDAVEIDQAKLIQIAESVLLAENVAAAEVSLAIVDDETIHALNRRYLDHDWPTDVISFSLQEEALPPEATPRADLSGKRIDGEIVISSETAARVAAEQGTPAEEEISLYLVHGLLHLCGFDDQTSGDRERMQERQQTHLQKFGIQPNY